LPKCLDSVFNQTLQDFEVIVVNDASTDDTAEVVKPYLDRIKFLSNDQNMDRNPTRMRGFDESSGQYLIFLDSDIEMQPDMLEKLYQALQDKPEASYAYGQFRFDGKFFHGYEFDPELLRKMNYIHTSALMRREHFPGFDLAITRFQDWDVWLTMLSNGYQGVFVPEEVFAAQVDPKEALSKWMPSFAYKIPWRYLGWTPKRIKDYEEAKRIIREKHNL